MGLMKKVNKRNNWQGFKHLKILCRKKHTVDLTRRKVSTTENKMLKTEKEYKGEKKVGRKAIELTGNPRYVRERCHRSLNDGQIRSKGGQQC